MSFHYPLTPSRHRHNLLPRAVDSPLKRQWQSPDPKAPTPSPPTPQHYSRTPTQLSKTVFPVTRLGFPFQSHAYNLPVYRRDLSPLTGTILGEIPRHFSSSHPFSLPNPPESTPTSPSTSSTIILSSPPHTPHTPIRHDRRVLEVRCRHEQVRPYTPCKAEPSYWVISMPYPREAEERLLPELKPLQNGGRRRMFPRWGGSLLGSMEGQRQVTGIRTGFGNGETERWASDSVDVNASSAGMEGYDLGNDLEIWESNDLAFDPLNGLPLFGIEQASGRDPEIVWEPSVLGTGSKEMLDVESGEEWYDAADVGMEMDMKGYEGFDCSRELWH